MKRSECELRGDGEVKDREKGEKRRPSVEVDVPVLRGSVCVCVCVCVCACVCVGVHAQGRVLVTGYGCSRKLETCTSLSRGQVSLCVVFLIHT